MKTIDAIAAEAMPFGSYVEVGEDGFARVDLTLECCGGVVKRPPGHRNFAEAGEAIEVATDAESIMADLGGGDIRMVTLIMGRIASPVPRPRRPKQYP